MYDVSVVVPTYNRLDLLRKAIDALSTQDGVSYEIIVADDCSTDGTGSYLEEAAASVAVPLRHVVASRNGGPAAARNLAWPLARAPYVAFTDDDCEPSTGWLRALLDEAERSDVDIVQGRTIPNPAHQRVSCWNRTLTAEKFSHRYQTCNLLVHGDVLRQLDGFDESYSFAGEDCDLGWRARAVGRRATYCADALVHHAVRPLDFWGYLKLRRGWSHLVRFHKMFPESRPLLLYRGMFFRQEHVAVVGGAVVGSFAVVVGAWWIVPVLYLVQVVRLARRHRFEGARPALRIKYAVAQPFAEAWEIAHFAAQSVRNRTLVL